LLALTVEYGQVTVADVRRHRERAWAELIAQQGTDPIEEQTEPEPGRPWSGTPADFPFDPPDPQTYRAPSPEKQVDRLLGGATDRLQQATEWIQDAAQLIARAKSYGAFGSLAVSFDAAVSVLELELKALRAMVEVPVQ
jgi:hypothetical protein